MNVAYTISPKDLRSFISHLFTQVSRFANFKKKAVILLVIVLTLTVIGPKLPSSIVEIGFGAALLWFSVTIIYSLSRSRHLTQYLLTESHGMTCGKHKLEFRDRLIIERTSEYELHCPWNQVFSVEEGADHVGLIMKRPPCIWIPKQAFALQEEQAAFLRYARTSTASAAEDIPTSPHPHYSRQQFYQGVHYIWEKQFWVIPALLSLLGIAMYHYHETTRKPDKTSSSLTERQGNEGQSYFRILPENTSYTVENQYNSKDTGPPKFNEMDQ